MAGPGVSGRVRTRVAVLAGGPDAEREVSLRSGAAIAEALRRSDRCDADLHAIERLTQGELRAIRADVIFPALHGLWGEGGPLQDLLEADGRPYVGSGPRGARHAMDKIATKLTCAGLGIPTAPAFVLDLRDDAPPIPLPLVIKPVHEGSTIGLHVCRTPGEWDAARHAVARQRAAGAPQVHMIEPFLTGRELTVGLVDYEPLPVIEIVPADGLYDYEAKYQRSDTQYRLEPALPEGVSARVREHASRLARAIGTRHVARADFILDSAGVAWALEINTLPGFTDHSLVPKAAAHAGVPMPRLCATLVELALRDHGSGARCCA